MCRFRAIIMGSVKIHGKGFVYGRQSWPPQKIPTIYLGLDQCGGMASDLLPCESHPLDAFTTSVRCTQTLTTLSACACIEPIQCTSRLISLCNLGSSSVYRTPCCAAPTCMLARACTNANDGYAAGNVSLQGQKLAPCQYTDIAVNTRTSVCWLQDRPAAEWERRVSPFADQLEMTENIEQHWVP